MQIPARLILGSALTQYQRSEPIGLRVLAGSRADPDVKHVPVRSNHPATVMPALVAGIHVFLAELQQAKRGWPGQARPRRRRVVQHDRKSILKRATKLEL